MSTQEIYNYRPVNENLILGGQPTAEQIQSAAQEGFRAVINLATYKQGKSLEGEAELARSLGMTYYHIPVDWQNPKESNFAEFERVIKQLAQTKTLLHCAANYRATAFYGLYAIKNLGWSEQDADEFRAPIWNSRDYPIWETFIEMMKAKIRAASEP
jgi:uncharacterized protein (TIGR01244 family)